MKKISNVQQFHVTINKPFDIYKTLQLAMTKYPYFYVHIENLEKIDRFLQMHKF